MREQGCGPPEAVMSVNAKCYTGHLVARTLRELGAHHIRIPPYTPRWNGKLERFFGTLEDEWACGCVWPNSATRDRALSSFLRYFNPWRPYSAAGGRPPISRVQQLRRQDNEAAPRQRQVAPERGPRDTVAEPGRRSPSRPTPQPRRPQPAQAAAPR